MSRKQKSHVGQQPKKNWRDKGSYPSKSALSIVFISYVCSLSVFLTKSFLLFLKFKHTKQVSTYFKILSLFEFVTGKTCTKSIDLQYAFIAKGKHYSLSNFKQKRSSLPRFLMDGIIDFFSTIVTSQIFSNGERGKFFNFLPKLFITHMMNRERILWPNFAPANKSLLKLYFSWN